MNVLGRARGTMLCYSSLIILMLLGTTAGAQVLKAEDAFTLETVNILASSLAEDLRTGDVEVAELCAIHWNWRFWKMSGPQAHRGNNPPLPKLQLTFQLCEVNS